jgi:hypothetical protein
MVKMLLQLVEVRGPFQEFHEVHLRKGATLYLDDKLPASM